MRLFIVKIWKVSLLVVIIVLASVGVGISGGIPSTISGRQKEDYIAKSGELLITDEEPETETCCLLE